MIINGTPGDDFVNIPPGDSVVVTGEGNDTVIDFYGTDIVDTGPGDDAFYFSWLHVREDDADQVFLGDGNDLGYMVLSPSSGNGTRTLDGGDGIDTLLLDGRNMLIGLPTIDFRQMAGSGSLYIGEHTLSSFERIQLWDTFVIQNVIFGDLDDYFEGRGKFNTVYGNGGDDYIDSGIGGDLLYGGPGNDVIVADGGRHDEAHSAFGEAGDDLIVSAFKAADYNSVSDLWGGPGSDGFAAALRTGNDIVMDFNLAEDWIGILGKGYSSYDLRVTSPLSINKYNVVDTSEYWSFDFDFWLGYQTVTWSVEYNKLTGDIWVDSDSKRLFLTLDQTPAVTPDHFHLMTTQTGTYLSDHLHGDENDNYLFGLQGDDIIWGRAGDDLLEGDSGNDKLYGEEGKDKLVGFDGDDTLLGGNDDDVLIGGPGRDHLFGGDGSNDVVDYRGTYAEVNISLLNGVGFGADAQGDRLSGIERVFLSNFGNGSITGDDAGNALIGNNGANQLRGLDGNDTLRGGLGPDLLNGGNGFDTADYRNSADGVSVNLGTGGASQGEAEGDTLRNIENAFGSNLDDDTLIGSNFGNVLRGYGGDDFLAGMGGLDFLRGGLGSDTFHFDAGAGVDTIQDFEDNIDRIEFDNFAGFTMAADALTFATDVGGDVVFNFSANGWLIVENATVAQITDDVFIV